ncbi:MAG TPA: hypothetical protein EYP14_07820, partial [Planctomycetaceae bacterium]|nr:hypothetical protein [Planctomycetaceae bacterium]
MPTGPKSLSEATGLGTDAARFEVTVPRVNRSFSYCIRAGREHSRWYRARAVDRPAVQTALLDVAPPGYTGLPARLVDGLLGDIPVFERSRLTFQLTFNKPVTSAQIEWLAPERLDEPSRQATEPTPPRGQKDDGPSLADQPVHADGAAPRPVTVSLHLSPDGRRATLVTKATLGGPFVFRLRDRFGLENGDEPSRRLQLQRDEPPQLELPGQPSRREVGPSDQVSLPVVATDDIGIGALELRFAVNDGQERTVPLESDQFGRRTVRHVFLLDLAGIGVKVGDRISYRVRAADTRPVPGPQDVWSDPRTLVVVQNAPPPGAGQLTARQKELKKELEQIIADLEENRSGVQELQKQALTALRSRKPFEPGEAVPARIQQQRELAGRVERLAERFEQHPLYANLTPDVRKAAREDLPSVQRTMQQLAGSSLKQQAERLKQSVAGLAEAERRLRDVASQFDRLAALERDLLELNRLAQRTKDLAADVLALEQRRAADASSQSAQGAESPEQKEPLPDQSQSPQELLERQQELSDALTNLLDRRPELLDAARQEMLDRLEQLAQRALELAEPQDLLAEALREQAGEQAQRTRPVAE